MYAWPMLRAQKMYLGILDGGRAFKTKRGDSGGQLDNCDDACCCSEYLYCAIARWRDRRTKTSEAHQVIFTESVV